LKIESNFDTSSFNEKFHGSAIKISSQFTRHIKSSGFACTYKVIKSQKTISICCTSLSLSKACSWNEIQLSRDDCKLSTNDEQESSPRNEDEEKSAIKIKEDDEIRMNFKLHGNVSGSAIIVPHYLHVNLQV
jgi:hypothetical protein